MHAFLGSVLLVNPIEKMTKMKTKDWMIKDFFTINAHGTFMARPHRSPVALPPVIAALGTADTLVEPMLITDAGIPSARLATCKISFQKYSETFVIKSEQKGLHIRRCLHLRYGFSIQ